MVDTKNSVYLQSLSIKDFKCFQGENILSFVEESESQNKLCQWTVFLGNNGTGKTNLLKVLSNLQRDKGFPYTFPIRLAQYDYEPEIHPSFTYNENDPCCIKAVFYANDKGCSLNMSSISDGISEQDKSIEVGYDNAHTFGTDDRRMRSLNLFSYGVNRCRTDKKMSYRESRNDNDTLYGDCSSLINLEDWILQLEFASKNNAAGASERLSLLKKLFQDSLIPDLIGFRCVTDERFNNSVDFITTQGTFHFEELGFGYQSMLSWIFDFCKKMFDAYPDSPNPFYESAILLIDEIDLHLHPQWQKNIIRDLSVMFPNVQFIVTTHSPLVIQTVENINLYVMCKDGDRTKIVHRSERTFQGWSVEEILRELMDLGEDTRSRKYRELMNDFDSAMNNNDINKAKAAYAELKKIVHPSSVDNKLLDMDLGQLNAMQNDKD